MKEFIVVFSPKGGVGKSTSSRFISYILAQNPANRILMIDLCQNSSAALNFTKDRTQFSGRTIFEYMTEKATFKEVVQQVPDQKNIYYIPSDEKVTKIASELNNIGVLDIQNHLYNILDIQGVLDIFTHIIVDTHPSQEDNNTKMSLFAAHHSKGKVLIPTLIDIESYTAAQQAAKIVARNFKVPYHIFFNRISSNALKGQIGKMNKIKEEQLQPLIEANEENFNPLAEVRRGYVTETYIRESSKISDFSSEGKTFKEYLKNDYSNKVIDDYKNLLNEIGVEL